MTNNLKHGSDLSHDEITNVGQRLINEFTATINGVANDTNICISCLIPLAAAALAAIASIVELDMEDEDGDGQTKH